MKRKEDFSVFSSLRVEGYLLTIRCAENGGDALLWPRSSVQWLMLHRSDREANGFTIWAVVEKRIVLNLGSLQL